jgi:hypothetical protein
MIAAKILQDSLNMNIDKSFSMPKKSKEEAKSMPKAKSNEATKTDHFLKKDATNEIPDQSTLPLLLLQHQEFGFVWNANFQILLYFVF